VKKVISIIATAAVYFCVATVLAQAIAFSTLWFKGALDEDRIYRVLAALHGVDIISLHAEMLAKEQQPKLEQVSYESVVKGRTLNSLDLDLRESAIDKGLLDLVNLQNSLLEDKELFDDVKKSYDLRLATLAKKEQDESLQQLQRTLEAIMPRQAKEQIVMMLDDNAMDDVVLIMKNMPTDKRKKIIAEFKQGEDVEILHRILTEIRKGEPLASEIQESRDKLQQFGSSP
jgi:hypothetical protein